MRPQFKIISIIIIISISTSGCWKEIGFTNGRCSRIDDVEETIWNSPIEMTGHIITSDENKVCVFVQGASTVCKTEKLTVDLSLIIEDNFPEESGFKISDITYRAYMHYFFDDDTKKTTALGLSGKIPGPVSFNGEFVVDPKNEKSNFGNIGVYLEISIPDNGEPFVYGYYFQEIIASARITLTFRR